MTADEGHYKIAVETGTLETVLTPALPGDIGQVIT